MTNTHQNPFCCETADERDAQGFEVTGTDHDDHCGNYDGAPVEQWEVTTPPDVYMV